MSKRYEALHVGYDLQRGQVPTFGGTPEIANALDSLGPGMEVSSGWERGGPIVWRPLNQRRLVGWMRGIPTSDVDRQGAWECWGLLVDDDIDISAWPWLLRTMLQSKQKGSLDVLGQRLLEKQGDTAPDQARELATVLTALHRHHRAGTDSPMTIPLNVPMHANALVPWIWLLGPFDPQNAFLGPPRKTAASASPPLIYHAAIGAAFPDNDPATQLPDLLDSVRKKGSLESAIQLGKRLRASTTEWFPLQSVEGPYRAAPFFRKDAYESGDQNETPQTSNRVALHNKLLALFRLNWDWPTVLRWTTVILLLLIIALLLSIARLLGPMDDGITDIRNMVQAAPFKSKSAGGKSRQVFGGTATTTATATETATTTVSVGANLVPPATDVIREMITRGVPGVTFMKSIKDIAKKGTPNDVEQTKLHVAALQTVFVKRGWAATDKPIDGSPGPGFFTAIKNAGSSSDLGRLLTDDQYLVAELQKR
jgi:hypothetical protein